MRLLLEVCYNKILFGKGAKISELVAAFDGAKEVDEEGGYSEPTRFIIKEDSDMRIRLINEDSISLPDNQIKTETKKTLEMFADLKEKNKKLEEENRELKSQLEKINETLSKKKKKKD